jgi:hypothetical protein
MIKHETGKLYVTEQIPTLVATDEKVKNPELLMPSILFFWQLQKI